MALFWQTVTSSADSKFLVKGTELSRAMVPGTGSRFQLSEVRTYTRDDYDRVYHVRDAHTVSDEEVREGVRPRVVAKFETEDEAVAFCMAEVERERV